MSRIEARDLDPDDIGQLVTVTDDSGESITMTLRRYTRSADGVTITGRCLGHVRRVADLPAWEVLHVRRAEQTSEPDDWELIDHATSARITSLADRLPPMPPTAEKLDAHRAAFSAPSGYSQAERCVLPGCPDHAQAVTQ